MLSESLLKLNCPDVTLKNTRFGAAELIAFLKKWKESTGAEMEKIEKVETGHPLGVGKLDFSELDPQQIEPDERPQLIKKTTPQYSCLAVWYGLSLDYSLIQFIIWTPRTPEKSKNLLNEKKNSLINPRFVDVYNIYRDEIQNLKNYILLKQVEDANFIMPLIRQERFAILYVEMEKRKIYYGDPLYSFNFEDKEIINFEKQLGMDGKPKIVKLKRPNLRLCRIFGVFPSGFAPSSAKMERTSKEWDWEFFNLLRIDL